MLERLCVMVRIISPASLSVLPEEVEKMTLRREVWAFLLRMLIPQPEPALTSQTKQQHQADQQWQQCLAGKASQSLLKRTATLTAPVREI